MGVKQYDYIILGAGASGLMLAYRMSLDEYFTSKEILIIDREDNKGDDRTWCFWEEGQGEWDEVLYKSWDQIYFGSAELKSSFETKPYRYKMIKSREFYKYLWKQINTRSNITFVKDDILSIEQLKDGAKVITGNRNYCGDRILSSVLLNKDYLKQKQYPVLQQHFIGWFIKLKQGNFDESVATFMDFDIPQEGNTRFMYVLPTSNNEALFEYTLFSKDLLEKSAYEKAIENYLMSKGYKDYEIVDSEQGSIPMTSYGFKTDNSESVLHIGTAGGWTKASTGYTFMSATKKTKLLIEHLKKGKTLNKFNRRTKFWYYDLLLLDVLSKHNGQGSKLFASMFKKAKLKTIFRFLDEESSIFEDLKIITSVPSGKFIKALMQRLF